MGWTEEKVDKLKELWGKGNTASQIAEIIGGITRNAVIGKAHRLNLSAKIKQRQTSSTQNQTRNSQRNIHARGRKRRFQSLLLDKNFEPAKTGGKPLCRPAAGSILLFRFGRGDGDSPPWKRVVSCS